MTTAEMIAIMQAYEDGKDLQYKRIVNGCWNDCLSPIWNWSEYEYRIKPEPTYRPYKDTDEMIADYKERFSVYVKPHAMPLIWVRCKVDGESVGSLITDFCDKFIFFAEEYGTSMIQLFEQYAYLDGSPIGKLVEE